jgi:hypothetical protein
MDSGARLTRWVGVVVAVHLALHLFVLATTQFGVHRDEFLYFSMGRHLRFWRMDFPPLIAVLANASRGMFSDRLASVVNPVIQSATSPSPATGDSPRCAIAARHPTASANSDHFAGARVTATLAPMTQAPAPTPSRVT